MIRRSIGGDQKNKRTRGQGSAPLALEGKAHGHTEARGRGAQICCGTASARRVPRKEIT